MKRTIARIGAAATVALLAVTQAHAVTRIRASIWAAVSSG